MCPRCPSHTTVSTGLVYRGSLSCACAPKCFGTQVWRYCFVVARRPNGAINLIIFDLDLNLSMAAQPEPTDVETPGVFFSSTNLQTAAKDPSVSIENLSAFGRMTLPILIPL